MSVWDVQIFDHNKLCLVVNLMLGTFVVLVGYK